VVFKYFGQLCLVLAALSLVPLVMSVIFGDTPISLRYGIVIGGLAALGSAWRDCALLPGCRPMKAWCWSR
jgi:NCAIR mutase (PurE)-related protein